jgi:hypothetical protein
MMAYTGTGVWVLEKKNPNGFWLLVDVFSKQEDAQTVANDDTTKPLRWDNAPFSSLGFVGKASLPLFKVSLRSIR